MVEVSRWREGRIEQEKLDKMSGWLPAIDLGLILTLLDEQLAQLYELLQATRNAESGTVPPSPEDSDPSKKP
jgi:hypothetical protein